jgi:hypothetical protein
MPLASALRTYLELSEQERRVLGLWQRREIETRSDIERVDQLPGAVRMRQRLT